MTNVRHATSDNVTVGMIAADRIGRGPIIPPWFVTLAATLGWGIIAAAWFLVG